MKKVLLHICCGPCAIYPTEALTKEGFSVEGFFYNPNIQPEEEYRKRKEAVESFSKLYKINVSFGEYEGKLYQDLTSGAEDKNSRCKSCFKLRLSKTHKFALSKGFDFFTSTLLVSPYQDQVLIKDLGEDVSKGTKSEFLFCDFRTGFRGAQNKSKELNFYRQKYCGCLNSLKEREQEKCKC